LSSSFSSTTPSSVSSVTPPLSSLSPSMPLNQLSAQLFPKYVSARLLFPLFVCSLLLLIHSSVSFFLVLSFFLSSFSSC
jgi:hypothetical protein